MELKERAIYQLPNGRELFVRRTRDDKRVLCNLSASETGEYELTPDGRLLFNGQLTAWELDDLTETGREAPPDVTAVLADVSPSALESGR